MSYGGVVYRVWYRIFFPSVVSICLSMYALKTLIGEAKFEVNPAKLIENQGMKSKDTHLGESIIDENQDIIEAKWKKYFGIQK